MSERRRPRSPKAPSPNKSSHGGSPLKPKKTNRSMRLADPEADPRTQRRFGEEVYINACLQFGIPPDKTFRARLLDSNDVTFSVDDPDTSAMSEGAVRAMMMALAFNTSIKRMSLRAIGPSVMTRGVMQDLANALSANTHLRTLDISHNGIGDVVAPAIADMLHRNVGLRVLDLSHNNLGLKGGLLIADALRDNQSITSINLAHNPFNKFAKVSNALGEGLSANHTIEFLSVMAQKEGAEPLLSTLQNHGTLRYLSMTHNKLSLRSTCLLRDLLLTGGLTYLDLTHAYIEDDGAHTLAFAVFRNETLTKLNLSHNSISKSGGISFAQALKSNTTLTDLNLSTNDMNDEFAECMSEALAVNDTVTCVDLTRNRITSVGGEALYDGIRNNTTLLTLGQLDTMSFKVSLRQLLESQFAANRATNIAPPLSREQKLRMIYANYPESERRIRLHAHFLREHVYRLQNDNYNLRLRLQHVEEAYARLQASVSDQGTKVPYQTQPGSPKGGRVSSATPTRKSGLSIR
eukprot:Rmarinus@m.12357